MANGVIINKKMVTKNKVLKANAKADKKANRDRKIDRGCFLRKNIYKPFVLKNEELVGELKEPENITFEELVKGEELIELIKETQLKGNGGGSDFIEKIKAFKASSKDMIIVNAAECEPGLLNDAWLLDHKAKELAMSLRLIYEALQPKKMVLATRGKKGFHELCKEAGAVSHVKVPLKYPLGEEHFLIRAVTGKKIDKNIFTSNEGIMVTNVQTIYQIYRLAAGVRDGGRLVTLANMKTGNARVAYIYPDEVISEKYRQCFQEDGMAGFNGVLEGGFGILGAEPISMDTTFGFDKNFATYVEESYISNDNKCRSCGKCARQCPMGIFVTKIVKEKELNPDCDISKYEPEKCIHCGTCTYFCIAGKDPAAIVAKG